jgi:hypothetical protein
MVAAPAAVLSMSAKAAAIAIASTVRIPSAVLIPATALSSTPVMGLSLAGGITESSLTIVTPPLIGQSAHAV